MKKQILFMMFLLLALMASNYSVKAQNLDASANCIVPTEIVASCIADAGELSPQAGVDYTYTVEIPNATGNERILWMVTTSQTFIDAATGNTIGLDATAEPSNGTSDYLLSVTSGTYNTATAGATSITLKWKSFTHDPDNPVFLLVYADDGGVCDKDNMDVWVIKPQHRFTLDLANLDKAGGDAIVGDHSTCVSPVVSAIYNTGTEEVEFDYGTNAMFFIVNAANWTTAWQPSFELGGLAGDMSVASVDWAYPADAVSGTWNATSVTTANVEYTASGATVDRVTPQVDGATEVGPAGECIIVRVIVNNNHHENTDGVDITLAVDGLMLDPASSLFDNPDLGDIHYDDGPSGECPWVDLFVNDIVTHTLTPRPDIDEVNPVAPSFEPTNRNADQ